MNIKRKDLTLFWICLLLFVIHQVIQKFLGINIKIVDDYADPFFAMPVILQLIVWERRIILKRVDYRLSRILIVAYIVLMGLIFELIFPYFNSRFVADPWDVFFYALGGTAYGMLHLASHDGVAYGIKKNKYNQQHYNM